MNRRYCGVILLLVLVVGSTGGYSLRTPPPTPVPASKANDRGCNATRIFPEWVSVDPSDQPVVAEGVVTDTLIAYHEVPFSHDSHDEDFNLKPDPAYEGLLSSAAAKQGNDKIMEVEWESKYFPEKFWPEIGDRAWVLGRHVFDCGHPPAKTEIHPPQAVAFTRHQPHIFAGDPAPSDTNQTYIFISGKAGDYNHAVGGRNYEFDVPLPPKPSATAELRTEIVETPFGGPKPILTHNPGANKVHVLYPLASVAASVNNKFGAIIACGWREAVLTRGYRDILVTLDSFKCNNDHDPDVPLITNRGEWRFWVGVNGYWSEPDPTLHKGVAGGDTRQLHRSVRFLVPENGAIRLRTTGYEDDCDSSFGVIHGLSLSKAKSIIAEINDNDRIGQLDKSYSAANNFGVGSQHDDLSRQNLELNDATGKYDPQESDTKGDFNLRYTIREIARFPVGTQNTPKKVTVTFTSVKLTDPTRAGKTGNVNFSFAVNGHHTRFPATGQMPLPLGADKPVTPPVSISVIVADSIKISMFVDDEARKVTEVIGVDEVPGHHKLIQEKETHALFASKEVSYTRATNFGAGTHIETSKPFSSATLTVTYRIDVTDAASGPPARAFTPGVLDKAP